jgi:hypothetical protein
VLRTQQAEIVSQVSEEWLREVARDPRHAEAVRNMNVGSYIIAPMVTQEGALGVISFVSHPSRPPHNQADLR